MKFKLVSVDEYVLQYDEFRQGILQKAREIIFKLASEAQEAHWKFQGRVKVL